MMSKNRTDATKINSVRQNCMKAHFLILVIGYSSVLMGQKNCQQQRQSFIPINELGSGYFRGYQGGLYPGGSNTLSGNYLQDLTQISDAIQPLDSNGQFSKGGYVVFIGVGASNPRTEFQAFQKMTDTFRNINKRLKTVNTCIGGQGVQKMNQANDNYWKQADKMMDSMGLSNLQVQIAWLETENTASADSSFPGGPRSLVSDVRVLLQMMKVKYPNLKVCYLSARTYAGWVSGGTGRGLEYPRDYYNGWAMKWVIDSAIYRANGFEYLGSTPEIPMPVYSTYNWTNGEQLRLDGFSVDCDTDFGGDGLHLSIAGENKIGEQLFRFFNTDINTTKWFREIQSTSIESYFTSTSVYPNPGNGLLYLKGYSIAKNQIKIYNSIQQEINGFEVDNQSIDMSENPSGLYWIKLSIENKELVLKYLKL